MISLNAMQKISVNGIDIYVDKADADRFCDIFKKDVNIYNLKYIRETPIHEPYGFNTLINKAQQYSDMDDTCEFFDMTGRAAVVCVKEFYLKHFRLLVKSDSAKDEFMSPISIGLSKRKGHEFRWAWYDSKQLKLDLYGSEYWSKDRREKLLDSVKQMRQVVKQANVSVVEKKLNKLKRSKSVTVRKIDKQKCKIGRTTYKYTYIAY